MRGEKPPAFFTTISNGSFVSNPERSFLIRSGAFLYAICFLHSLKNSALNYSILIDSFAVAGEIASSGIFGLNVT